MISKQRPVQIKEFRRESFISSIEISWNNKLASIKTSKIVTKFLNPMILFKKTHFSRSSSNIYMSLTKFKNPKRIYILRFLFKEGRKGGIEIKNKIKLLLLCPSIVLILTSSFFSPYLPIQIAASDAFEGDTDDIYSSGSYIRWYCPDTIYVDGTAGTSYFAIHYLAQMNRIKQAKASWNTGYNYYYPEKMELGLFAYFYPDNDQRVVGMFTVDEDSDISYSYRKSTVTTQGSGSNPYFSYSIQTSISTSEYSAVPESRMDWGKNGAWWPICGLWVYFDPDENPIDAATFKVVFTLTVDNSILYNYIGSYGLDFLVCSNMWWKSKSQKWHANGVLGNPNHSYNDDNDDGMDNLDLPINLADLVTVYYSNNP